MLASAYHIDGDDPMSKYQVCGLLRATRTNQRKGARLDLRWLTNGGAALNEREGGETQSTTYTGRQLLVSENCALRYSLATGESGLS